MIKDLFDKNLILESERLLLRPIKKSDTDDIFEIFSDIEVMKYYDLLPFLTKDDAINQVEVFRKCLSEKTMIRWGIELKESGKLIGTCGFFAFSEESLKAEMGYELNREYWNKGIMSEALKMIMDFIFRETDINRIEAYVEPMNTASLKLLESLGFTKEGLLRQYELCRGGLIDITIWGLLRSDLK